MAETQGWTREYVEARLLEAGRTMMALFVPGTAPAGFRSNMPEVIRTMEENYGWEGNLRVRADPPSRQAIGEMEQALSWIRLLPADRVVMRKIVGMRMLCLPWQDRPRFSWREVGERMGASHTAVRVWHGQAIDMIVAALRRPGLCAASGGRVGPGRVSIEGAVRRAAEGPRVRRRARELA